MRDTPQRRPVLTLAWARRFAVAVRDSVQQEPLWSTKTTCIPTMRVAVATARAYGLRCVALSGGVMVDSRTHKDLAGGTTGTGILDQNGTWDAHLFGVLDGQYLIDPAADQFRREEFDIPGYPWACLIPPAIAGSLPGHQVDISDAAAGVSAVYSVHPANRQGTWETMAWWCEYETEARRATARAVRALQPRRTR